MKAGPVEVVRAKRIEIPIYSSPVAGRENYVVSYYVDGRRKRDLEGTTLEAARDFARTKIEELATGTAHVGALTPKQLAVVNDAVDVLKNTGVSLSRATREYAEAFRILGREPLIIKAAEHYAAHLEQEKRKVGMHSGYPARACRKVHGAHSRAQEVQAVHARHAGAAGAGS